MLRRAPEDRRAEEGPHDGSSHAFDRRRRAVGVVHEAGHLAGVAGTGPQALLEGVEGQVGAQAGRRASADEDQHHAIPPSTSRRLKLLLKGLLGS